MFPNQQGGHGQLPTHWQPPNSQQPANGSYPPPPPHMTSSHQQQQQQPQQQQQQPQQQQHPPHPAHPPHLPLPQEPRPDMAAHQHLAHQQPYRLPGPQEWSQGPPPHNPYRGHAPPPPQNYMATHHQPPAPRQRTAIACRYCRRRKIRCSGFEATDDGRCSNCMRFNQDCIFTPVSAQTQAFVPAHTVWRGVGHPPPMYGAYGQPLPPASHAEGYGQSPRQQAYLPSPLGPPGPSQAHYAHGPPAAPHDEASRDLLNGRKRPNPEPHTPTLPPPLPGSASRLPHRGAGSDHMFPETSSLTSAASPATSTTSYSSAPPPTGPSAYYGSQPPRQGSPQGPYAYDASRASSSPHTQGPTTPGAAHYYPAASQPNGQTNGALNPPPPRSDGTTPPPTASSSSSSRPSMRINDLVSDNKNNNSNGPSRSSTDSNMLNMLNRRPM